MVIKSPMRYPVIQRSPRNPLRKRGRDELHEDGVAVITREVWAA